MKVSVRYFAVLRDRRGVGSETIEWGGGSAREFADGLVAQHLLGLPSALVRIAVNGEFVADETLLSDGDEVVLIPPVAGG